MERLRKAWALSMAEWAVLWQAWMLLLVVELGLRLLPFRSFLAYVQCPDAEAPALDLGTSPIPIPRLARLVSIAARYHLIRTTCLKEACVLSLLLRRRGVPSILRIGVALPAGALKAHAWLEHGGQIVFGLRQQEEYEPIL